MTLSEYLGEISDRRFAYGALDCCTFMADWLMRCGLPDAMADRRGCYTTRACYRRLIRSEGGLVASCRARFAKICLAERPAAFPGDVCLVAAPILRNARRTLWAATGAIAVSDRWRAVVTVDAGLVCAELEVLYAWRVNDA
jgi:hypothetical protein